MTCECGNPKPNRRAVGCLDCQRIERERKAAESTTAAVVNAIRRLDDWPSAVEIAAWAGIDSEDCSARLNWPPLRVWVRRLPEFRDWRPLQ